ncbi:hypothetical protein BB561_001428 [Smittium simulii]|uniref:Uncharacterized protein n=1 Tax=Smittium simulii TaxID=133385 RepID=A0A2T9YUP7_9FUNG|nr:hypothetical protein BB561_001428 [Smittium simulii]
MNINDPKLFQRIKLVDALTDILYSNVPPVSRPKRDVITEDIPKKVYSFDEIEQLVQTNSWRMISLATKMSITQLASDETALILQLGLYKSAYKEVSQLETAYKTQNFALYHEDNEHTGDQDAWLADWPFELCLLRASLPNYSNKDLDTSINRFCELIQFNKNKKFWLPATSVEPEILASLCKTRSVQLLVNLVGLLLLEKSYTLAIDLIQEEIAESKDDVILLSFFGRCGYISKAYSAFKSVCELDNQSELDTMNWAYYYVSVGDWKQAKLFFGEALKFHSNDLNYTLANNEAICEFYLGNIPGMLQSLEKIMQEMPSAAGTDESLVYNYCSAVELACSGSWQKSLKVQKIIDVGQWAGDGFNTKVFKFATDS